MSPLRPEAPAHDSASAAEGGNRLLWVLLAGAGLLAVLQPRAPLDYLKLVDWHTLGALAGLLLITQGIEHSGVLQSAARRLLGHTHSLRALAFALCASAALLSALLTNDVSLFLLIPLTRALALRAHLPLPRLVVLQALAVNAGSALTPIGNPQNLFLWQRSGLSFLGFMDMMAPLVALMLLCLALAVWRLVPATPITLREDAAPGPREPRLLAVSALLLALFVVALDQGWLPAGLLVVAATFALLRPRLLVQVDWTLLAIIGLMFIDLRLLAQLPQLAALLGHAAIADGAPAFLAAVLCSQLISNVPAAILLEQHVRDLPALAAGVSVGGFGIVIGSLANLIALRLARLPHGLRDFHRVSLPFLLVCTVLGLLLHGA